MGESRPNPNPELEKYEVSLDLSKISWSSDELVEAYQLAASTKKLALIDTKGFKTEYLPDATSGEDVLAFFARTQKGRGLRRFASAWTLSTAQSERQKPGPDGDDFEETYGVTFDPKKFILTADRAVTAYNGLKAYKTLHPAPLNLKAVGNVSDPVAELRRLSGLRVMSQGIVALIPTIEFKTVDQFDFLTVGSLLVPNPLIEGSIETITLTWNFSKALDTTKKRRDLFKAIAAHKELFKKEQKKILPEKPSKPMQFLYGRLSVPAVFGSKHSQRPSMERLGPARRASYAAKRPSPWPF